MLYDPGPEYTKFDEMENITEEERRFLRTVPNKKGFSISGRVLEKVPGSGSGLGQVGVMK